MAALDWSQCPEVESVLGRCGGTWVLRDTRIPIWIIFDNLAAGSPIEEIVEQFSVTADQVIALLEFVARNAEAHVAAIETEPVNAGFI
jgi:uncharacterized protein (DUF433 family)